MTSDRSFASLEAVPPAFDAGRLGRLTWLGLAVAALGWAMFIAAAASADHWWLKVAPGAPDRVHADIVGIAECSIGSGFALATIGTLRTGFGALNRFFTAVLDRSTSRPVANPQVVPVPSADAAVVEDAPQHRPYSILADGSVEVETILGTRRFATMAEARDFI